MKIDLTKEEIEEILNCMEKVECECGHIDASLFWKLKDLLENEHKID